MKYSHPSAFTFLAAAAKMLIVPKMAYATDPYFVQETGSCADNGGTVVQTNDECQDATVALGLTTESSFDGCTPDHCQTFFYGLSPWTTNRWEYDTYVVGYRPSGCGMWDNRHIRWSGLHANEVCGSDGFFCICKAAATNSPTTRPTKAPTNIPTTSPTKNPTESPSRTPWDIADPSISADFSNTTDENGIITTSYTGTTPTLLDTDPATLTSFLVNGHCDTSTSKGLEGSAIANTGTCSVDGSGSLSTNCEYQFNKSSMNNYTGYAPDDEPKPTLKVCEVAQLSYKNMIIEEMYHNITVAFETSASFTVSSIALDAATAQSSNQTTSLADYISAAQCDDPNANMAPNAVLCIRISSNSPDVLIESIDEMDITGNDDAGGSLEVYDGSAIKYTAITSETYSPLNGGPPRQRVEVRTRVPSSQFNFEATGAKIDISGSVTVKLAGSERRLTVAMDRLLQTNEDEETAEFDVTVNLVPESELALEDGYAMVNSAKAPMGRAFAIASMVLVSAFALW